MAGDPNQLSGAIQQYFARLYAQPDDRDAYKTLEAILVQTGDWRRLADANELVGDGIFDAKERLQSYLRAGGLYEQKLNDDVNAARLFAKCVGVAPADNEALGGYLRVLVKTQQWATALAALQNAVEAVPEPRRRAELLLDSARFRAARLDDVPGALGDFRRALVEDASVPRFREAAETTLGGKGAWEELALLWKAFAETTRDPIARAGALVDAAHVYRDRVHRPGDAAAMLEASAEGQPPGARTFVEAGILYEQAGRWTDVLRLLDRERSVTTDRLRLRAILQKIAEIQAGPLGDPSGAADTWSAILKVYPDDDSAQQAVIVELQRAGRWEDLANLNLRELERERDPARWREIALATARLYEERLASVERAMRLYEDVAKRDPADVEVIEALTRVYEARGRWADLAATCERAAGLLGEVAGRPYLHHAASLHEFRLGRSDRATQIYRQLLDGDSTDEFAASALVRLYRDAGDHAPLARVLGEFAKISGDASARRDALAERGALLVAQLGDPVGGVEAFESALKDDPEWVPGLQVLQDALRRSIEAGGKKASGKTPADVGELQEKLISALGRELKKTDAAENKRRAELCQEMGELCEVRGRPEEARGHYEGARKEVGDDLNTLEPLGRLYHAAGMEPEEAGVLRDLARLRREATGRAQAWFVLGQILGAAAEEGRIGAVATEEERTSEEPWVTCWRKALKEDPRHRNAIAALAEHAELQEDWDRAVELLSQQANVTSDPAERAVLLTRAGDHQRVRMDDEVGAMAKYAAAVSLAPRHIPAARPLADALFRSRRWAEVEPLYRRLGSELALENSPRGAAEAYWRGGVTYRELSREEDAIAMWRRAVDADSTCVAALDDLATMLRKRAEWRGARDVYVKILNLAREGRDAAKQSQTQRALAVIAEALNEPEEAIDRYKKVVAIDPGD
ncbi:MAG TPA: tetratricopeptide repeat protein, partial [bacterium]|nr:tetratricopeptide repeat protein [bacterium]